MKPKIRSGVHPDHGRINYAQIRPEAGEMTPDEMAQQAEAADDLSSKIDDMERRLRILEVAYEGRSVTKSAADHYTFDV